MRVFSSAGGRTRSISSPHRLSGSSAPTPAYSRTLDHFHSSARFTRPRHRSRDMPSTYALAGPNATPVTRGASGHKHGWHGDGRPRLFPQKPQTYATAACSITKGPRTPSAAPGKMPRSGPVPLPLCRAPIDSRSALEVVEGIHAQIAAPVTWGRQGIQQSQEAQPGSCWMRTA